MTSYPLPPGHGFPPPPVPYAFPSDPASLPVHGCGPLRALGRLFAKGFQFHGRASRSEFDWAYLMSMLIMLVLLAFALIVGFATSPDGGQTPGPAFVVFAIPMMLLYFAIGWLAIPLSVRRLHDLGVSGWWYLTSLIPFVGMVMLVFLMFAPSNPTGVRFDRPARY